MRNWEIPRKVSVMWPSSEMCTSRTLVYSFIELHPSSAEVKGKKKEQFVYISQGKRVCE